MYKPAFKRIAWPVCVFALSVSAGAVAEDSISFKGYVQFDKRFLVETDGAPQYPIYHKGFVELEALPSDELEVHVSTMLRYYDFAVLDDAQGVTRSDQVFPLDVLLWEAYASMYDFGGIEGLDLKVGKQRIAWGTADKLNPTDNLNPDDFTDFFNFGEKVPTWALKGEWAIWEDYLKLTFVFLPGIVPVSLPRFGEMPFGSQSELPSMEIPENVKIDQVTTSAAGPKYDFEHMMQAVKLSGTLLSVDWSVSYFHGWDDLFMPSGVNVELASLNSVDVHVRMGYPEINVLGFDFAGELFSVGWWAEVGVFFPKKFATFITVPTGINSYETTTQIALDDDPYVKYTLGLDYTFDWGTYVNIQFSHGFFTERGDDLHDYLFARLEQKFLEEDTLKIALGGLWETNGFEDIDEDYGIGVFPEITWKPYDNVDAAIGYFMVMGGGKSLFSSFDDWDMAYLKLKVSF